MSDTPTPSRAATGDRPPTAVEQAAQNTYTDAGDEPMSEEQLMPTCMIWVMFITLGILLAAMLLWVVANLPNAIGGG
jgi:hypothetical protein